MVYAPQKGSNGAYLSRLTIEADALIQQAA